MVSVVLSGVGGQGILTLANLIANAAMIEGYEVRLSEVHGMAQRGGSVMCHVKFGSNVYSPLIIEGSADIIIALEALEALRVAHYLKSMGVVILNDLELPPPLAIIRGFKYPSFNAIVESFSKATKRLHIVKAQKIAENLGSLKVTNTVILGAAWATGELEIRTL